MAGHNKWTQIKRKKEVADGKKSREFSLLAKQIQLEAKRSDGDKNSPGLKAAIERARAANLPNGNIERAIHTTVKSDHELTRVYYEAYGPGGAAIIIETLTDNKNRTTQEIKHILNKHGATLAVPDAAMWAFAKDAGGNLRPKTIHQVEAAALERLRALERALAAQADVQQTVFDVVLTP